MRWLEGIGTLLETLGRWVVGLALLGLLCIVTLQFVDRHLIDIPIAAPDSYARILLIWVAFVGFALAGRAGLAIRVDLFDHLLPDRVRRIFEIAFDLTKLAILSVLVVKGWALVEIGTYQTILGTDVTTAVPNAGLWVGCIMLLVFVVIALARLATGRMPAVSENGEIRSD